MSDAVRRYLSPQIVVSYEAHRCIHAAACIRGQPAVFDTARRPWILPSAASADAIAAVIQECPSGALHFTRTDGGASEADPEENTIVPMPHGPLHVRGRVDLRAADGSSIVEDVRLTLCRCGKSRNKPFCDNSHRAEGFDDLGMVSDGGAPAEANTRLKITATTNGPLLAEGTLMLRSSRGSGCYASSVVELCRCGGSSNKPFCDGTHERIGFRS